MTTLRNSLVLMRDIKCIIIPSESLKNLFAPFCEFLVCTRLILMMKTGNVRGAVQNEKMYQKL